MQRFAGNLSENCHQNAPAKFNINNILRHKFELHYKKNSAETIPKLQVFNGISTAISGNK